MKQAKKNGILRLISEKAEVCTRIMIYSDSTGKIKIIVISDIQYPICQYSDSYRIAYHVDVTGFLLSPEFFVIFILFSVNF
jgi:hypothetical protein